MTPKGEQSCVCCWATFAPTGRVAVLVCGDGDPLGPVCPTCAASGADGIRERLLERAASLRAQAWLLESEAEAGIEIVQEPPVIVGRERPGVVQ